MLESGFWMLDGRGAPIYRDTPLRGHMCALRSHGLAVSRDARGSSGAAGGRDSDPTVLRRPSGPE
jgi:hypothetical protein